MQPSTPHTKVPPEEKINLSKISEEALHVFPLKVPGRRISRFLTYWMLPGSIFQPSQVIPVTMHTYWYASAFAVPWKLSTFWEEKKNLWKKKSSFTFKIRYM